jgi:cytochrome b6-f complex iron-sulfur subunit
MKRRDFFLYSLWGMVVTAVGGMAYSALRYLSPGELAQAPEPETLAAGLNPAGNPAPTGPAEVPLASLPLGEARLVALGSIPALVVHQERGFVAFNATCTHLGCLVKWDPGQKMFVCPCHAGQYNEAGEVVAGPPPTGLRKLPVEVKGEKIVVKPG